jgi:hypothetical protein
VRNFTSRNGDHVFPQIEARATIEGSGASRVYYARDEPDLRKPAPSLRWAMGRLAGEEHQFIGEICTESGILGPRPPWFIRFELLNNQTDMSASSGIITRLDIRTSDFENHAYDMASADGSAVLRGGPNPHDTCPLVAERSQG